MKKGLTIFLLIMASIILSSDSLYVGKVEFVRRPVFPPEDGFDYFPFPLLNKLHINTRDFVLLRYMPFDKTIHPENLEFMAQEARRILRSREFVGDAEVEMVSIKGDTVDFLFQLDEVWTTKPSASLAIIGERLEYGVDFTESNFLGLGSEVEIEFEHTVDDDFLHLKLETAPILPYDTKLSLFHDRNNRFNENRAAIARPFMTGNKKLLFEISYMDGIGQQDRFFHTDSILFEYDLDQVCAGGGVYYRLFRDIFAGLGFSHLQRDIYTPEYREKIRTNTIYAGLSLLKISYERQCPVDEFSCEPDIATGISAGIWLSLDNKGQPGLSFNAIYHDDFPFGLVAAGVKREHLDYMYRNNVYLNFATPAILHSRFVTSGQYSSYEGGTDVDFFDVGSRNNLRGFSYREIVSDRLLTANLELRVFPPREFLSIRASFILFSDWGTCGDGWLYSLGTGLRLTSSKSTSGTIGRFEVAFPMNRDKPEPTFIVKTELPFEILKDLNYIFYPVSREKVY